MKSFLISALLALGLLFTSCVGSKSDSEVKVDTWFSPKGTVQLDYLLGHDVGCKAVTLWLDSIKTSYREEDPQTLCKAYLVYQDPDYLTYFYHVRTLPSDYYEGDENYCFYTFVRQDGHFLTPAELTDDIDALSAQVLARTRLENAWAIESLGGEEAFLSMVRNFAVGVTARGVVFCTSLMEETWQSVCTIPSSEMKPRQ